MTSSTTSFTPTASHHADNQNGTPPRSRTRNALDMVNAGGIGVATMSSQPTPSAPIHDLNSALDLYSKQYLPGHTKSLSGIAIRSLLLGIVLTTSLTLTLLLLYHSHPLWRLPFFLTTLSTFHFLEFWTTATYNPPSASISSFLLSQNGSAYTVAHSAAILECLLTNLLFPTRQLLPPSFSLPVLFCGLALITLGQAIRTYAMISAGTNFNHIVQHTKATSHSLVTSGIYAWLRHPSYFGYFWWGLGTQIMMGNVICFVGYAVVLWRFFSRRIKGEEDLLVKFFGDDYVEYRKRSWVGIPGI